MSEKLVPEPADASPDIEVLPLEDEETNSENIDKNERRIFKVNFSFANDPKFQSRKRRMPPPKSPVRVQTQITDFKTARGSNVEKGEMKPVRAPLPNVSTSDDGSAGLASGGVGARYLGGTRQAFS